MGTVTTKTYLKRTFGRALAIELADGPSGYHSDSDGLYIMQDGAPLDTREYKHTLKVVVIETALEPICPAGYYDDYAMTNAMTDTVIDDDGVTWYRLVVSAATRRDALDFYTSIKGGETEPSMPFPAYQVDTTPALEA